MSTSYANILDADAFDQYLDDEANVRMAYATASSDLTVEPLPASDAVNHYAMTVNGVTGSAEDVFQGGCANTRTSVDLSFLFEVDQEVRFSTYLFTEYGGGGHSKILLSGSPVARSGCWVS